MATIELVGIEKRYGDSAVVKGVDLAIKDGEFIVLVGPSGCGKSTTLRMLAGLESISAGELRIDGRRVNDTPAKDRDIAMVFQSYALYPHMSVRQNIGFGLKVRGTPKAEVNPRVEDVARMLGLEALLDRKPSQLSGGQRQRVAMGRAIVRRPNAFLFDEPLSNLDAKLRTEVRAEIHHLHRELRTTTVYVTHDQVEAMTLAERVVILHEGVVQQVGPPLEVYRAPANRFVAGFLGTPTMNFFDGQPDGENFLSGQTTLPLAVPAQTRCVAIRPGEMHAASSIDDGERVVIGELVVDVVEHLGAEGYVYGDFAGVRVCARIDDDSISYGQAVRLGVNTSAVHLFDGDDLRIDVDGDA